MQLLAMLLPLHMHPAAQAEDALSDTDDEDAPDVELEVRPPQSLQDVADVFPGLGESFLLTATDDAGAVVVVSIFTPDTPLNPCPPWLLQPQGRGPFFCANW